MDTTNLVSEAQHERFENIEARRNRADWYDGYLRDKQDYEEFPVINSVVVLFVSGERAVYECHSYGRAIEILAAHDSSKVIGFKVV